MSQTAVSLVAEPVFPRAGLFRRYAPELAVFGLGALAFLINGLRPSEAAPDAAAARIIQVPSVDALRHSPQDLVGDAVDGDADPDALQRWLRGEVLYREALRLGLDEGDIIVRRRLIQKMEYVLDGMTALPQIDAESLQAYYHRHADRYRQPASYRFSHRFFSAERGLETARERAAQALVQLAGVGPDAALPAVGDPYPDGARFAAVSASRLLQTFGEEFLSELDAAPEGRWAGPYRSRHGLHLVYREHSTPAQLRPLQEAYPQVARDFLDEARRRQREQRYAEIEAGYVLRGR